MTTHNITVHLSDALCNAIFGTYHSLMAIAFCLVVIAFCQVIRTIIFTMKIDAEDEDEQRKGNGF